MARKNSSIRALGALLLCTSLVGCTATEAGTGTPNPQAKTKAETPLTGAEALGDFSTVDFCALINPVMLTQAGAQTTDSVRKSFSSCSLSTTVGGKPIKVVVGNVDLPTTGIHADRIPESSQQLPRKMALQRRNNAEANCHYYLVFSDGISLRAETSPESNSDVPKDSLCALSKAAMVGAALLVNDGKVGHVTFPEKSLGRLDACSVYTVEQAVAELGRPSITTAAFPSKHECQWGETQSPIYISVFMVLSKRPQINEGSTEEVIATRPSIIRPDQSFCTVSTVHEPVPGTTDEVEIAAVNASVPNIGKDACAVAKSVANTVWPRLPA